MAATIAATMDAARVAVMVRGTVAARDRNVASVPPVRDRNAANVLRVRVRSAPRIPIPMHHDRKPLAALRPRRAVAPVRKAVRRRKAAGAGAGVAVAVAAAAVRSLAWAAHRDSSVTIARGPRNPRDLPARFLRMTTMRNRTATARYRHRSTPTSRRTSQHR